MRIEYNHNKTYSRTVNNQIGTDHDFNQYFPDLSPFRTVPALTNDDCIFVDPNNGSDNNIGTKFNPVNHVKMVTEDLYNHTGTVDLSGGHDWNAQSQSFRLKWKYRKFDGTEAWYGSTGTVTLTDNCTSLDEIVAHINAKLPSPFLYLLTAYKTDDNKIGLKNIPDAVYQYWMYGKIIAFELIAGLTNDALPTFGWTAAVYDTSKTFNNAFVFTSTEPGTGNIICKEMFELNTGREINIYVGQMDESGVLSGNEYGTMKFDTDFNGDFFNYDFFGIYLGDDSAAKMSLVSDITGNAYDEPGLEKCIYILAGDSILRSNGKTVYYTNTDIQDPSCIVEWGGKLYCSSNSSSADYRGVWQSSDGETWTHVFSTSLGYHLFVWKNTLYVSTNSAGGALWYTTNGTSWTIITGTNIVASYDDPNPSYVTAGNDQYCYFTGGYYFDGETTEYFNFYSILGSLADPAAVFSLNNEIYYLFRFSNDYSKIYKVIDKSLSYVCDLPAAEYDASDYLQKYWFVAKEIVNDIEYMYLGTRGKTQDAGGSTYNINHYIFRFDGTTLTTVAYKEELGISFPVAWVNHYQIRSACIYQGKMYFPYNMTQAYFLAYRELSIINTHDEKLNIQGFIFDGDSKAAYGIVPCRQDCDEINLKYNRYQNFSFAGIGHFCNNMIISNSIFDICGFGIYFNDDPDIDDCIFIDCTYGIYSDSTTPDVEHCTFFECTTGVELTSTTFSSINFKNHIFHECSYDLVLPDTNEQDIDYCLFNSATMNVEKGDNCLNDQNPLFNDDENHIFTLWNKGAGNPIDSPAVDAADDNRDLGAWDVIYSVTGDTWDEYEFSDEITEINLGSEAVNSEELFTMNGNLKTSHEGIRKIWSVEFIKGALTKDYYNAELLLNDTGVKRLYPAPKDGNTITGFTQKVASCTFESLTGKLTAVISNYNLKTNSLDSAFIRVNMGTGTPTPYDYRYFVIEYNTDDGNNHIITATNIFGYTGLSDGIYDVDIKHCCFWGNARIDSTNSNKLNFDSFTPAFITNQWRNFLFRVVDTNERFRIDSNDNNSITFTDVYEYETTFTEDTDYSIMIECQLVRMKPENLDVETQTGLNGLQHGAELYVRTRTLERPLQNWQGHKLTFYEVEDYE